MPFVKINEYWVNLDYIVFMQDQGEQYFVMVDKGVDGKLNLFVKKGTAEGSSLAAAIVKHSQ
jgi:hypothetical protein